MRTVAYTSMSILFVTVDLLFMDFRHSRNSLTMLCLCLLFALRAETGVLSGRLAWFGRNKLDSN